MKRKQLILVAILCFGITTTGWGSARIAYTRPGHMMKIPFSSVGRSPYLFRAGFGLEIHNLNPMNTAKGVCFDTELGKNFHLGFSAVTGADTTALSVLGQTQVQIPVEFGFHLQQRVYTYNDISISAGVQDIVFQNIEGEGLRLNPDELSFFTVINSEKKIGTYAMKTFMGFGTGSIASTSPDTATIATDTTNSTGISAGVFLGFILKTPYFTDWGGLDLVGEFDGTGVNVGLRIPLTSDYRLNIGFTHIEKLPDWDTKYWNGHPGITLGIDMSVPKKGQGGSLFQGASTPTPVPSDIIGETGMPIETPSGLDSTLLAADFAVNSIKDSISMMNNEMRNLIIQLSAKEQESQFLEKALKTIRLDNNIAEKKANEAMRHLSRSLRYFYSGDYRGALKEVEAAIDVNPGLALAYARRGSIYYKLGDIQRATIDWNLALRLDPEYDDVRNILKALHENRLKTTSITEE